MSDNPYQAPIEAAEPRKRQWEDCLAALGAWFLSVVFGYSAWVEFWRGFPDQPNPPTQMATTGAAAFVAILMFVIGLMTLVYLPTIERTIEQ